VIVEQHVKVNDILAVKGRVVVTVQATDDIATLSARLREKRIGAAVVSKNGHSVDGVISERDIAYAVATHKADLHTLPVATLMTSTVITCAPADQVSEVASTMIARNIRHVPVVEENRLVGMISIRDVLNFRVSDLQRQTSMLRAFASDTGRKPQDRE
jgi:CBS domain-containing protein